MKGAKPTLKKGDFLSCFFSPSYAFSARRDREAQDQAELTAPLDQQIGQLKVELDGLKKKAGALRC